MDFTRSHHYVLGYDRFIGQDWKLKAEAYYQQIENAPVEREASSFSMLNAGADFGTPDEDDLVNEGKGRNYGLELTLEKFFSRSYYFLLTSSLFNSEYKGSDGKWRDTAFNGQYVFNALGGKEWNIGSKDNELSVYLKSTLAGGRKYSPIELEASQAAGSEEVIDNEAFTLQYGDYFRLDLKIAYRMNRKRSTHEFSLDLQNVTNRQNEFRRSFNARTGAETVEYQLGLFPVPQYRILF